jgi:hypothetical protein
MVYLKRAHSLRTHSNVGTPAALYSKIVFLYAISSPILFCNLSRRRSEHYVWWVLLDLCHVWAQYVGNIFCLFSLINHACLFAEDRYGLTRSEIAFYNHNFLQVLATLVGSLRMHVVSSSYSHPKLVLIRMQFLTSSFQLTNKAIL